MKILYYSDSPTSSFIINRIKALRQMGVEVDYLVDNNIIGTLLFSKRFSKKIKNPKIDNIKYHYYLGVPYILQPVKRIKNIFIKGNYDMLHIHHVTRGYIGYLLKKKYNIPYIVTAHGSDVHTIPYQNKYYKKKFTHILENAHKVIFVSDFLIKEAISLGYSGTNAVVIPNGIDFEKFKKTMSLPNINKTVGFIGNLLSIKGADKLPKIFKKISASIPKCNFYIVGSGHLKEQIQKEIEKYNLSLKVVFFDRINNDDISEQLNKTDVILIPSRNEGFGIVALEAQACGVPVVAANVGGLNEVLSSGSKLIEDNSIKGFADAAISILNSHTKKLDIEGLTKFSITNTMGLEYSVYKNLINS